MRVRLVRLGNSKGVRIPKVFLQEAGLGEGDELEIEVEGGQITLRPVKGTRAGWEEAFKVMAERGDDHLLDEDMGRMSTWDEEEWQW